VSPEDQMPPQNYPLQAPADESRGNAREDAIPSRFAKYLDQVEARASRCDDLSPGCITECGPGDSVTLEVGNTELDARVVSASQLAAQALEIEFVPSAAIGFTSAYLAPCPPEAGCTAFLVCRGISSCVAQDSQESFNIDGTLRHTYICPRGTELCGTIRQVIGSKVLKKGGKTCRAGAGGR